MCLPDIYYYIDGRMTGESMELEHIIKPDMVMPYIPFSYEKFSLIHTSSTLPSLPAAPFCLYTAICLVAQNRLVLFSTHIVSDIEYIAKKILVMKDGQVIQEGNSQELLKTAEGKVWAGVMKLSFAPPIRL